VRQLEIKVLDFVNYTEKFSFYLAQSTEFQHYDGKTVHIV